MLNFDIITLFPQLLNPFTKELPLKRALEKKLIQVNLHNLRDFTSDTRKTVDSRPYGGGAGMILMIEPIFKALEKMKLQQKSKIIVLTPKGEEYTHKKAVEYSKLEQLVILCGRYEGIDARVLELGKLLHKEKAGQEAAQIEIEAISIGKYVLSGGEIPAAAIIESTTRLLPGVINESALKTESYNSVNETPEHPQYTRPEDFMGLKVPKILLSGHHKNIEEWREFKNL